MWRAALEIVRNDSISPTTNLATTGRETHLGTHLSHHNFGATANEEDGVTTVKTVMTINHPAEERPAGSLSSFLSCSVSQLSLFPLKRRVGWLTMIHVAFIYTHTRVSSQLPEGKHAREREREKKKTLGGGVETLL